MKWNEICYWNTKTETYGSRAKIPKTVVIGILSFLCIITPATNWMIPIVIKKAKDIVLTWG